MTTVAASPDSRINASILKPSDTFVRRHIGPSPEDVQEMLQAIGADSLEQLVEQTVPASIRLNRALNLGEPRGEHELLAELKAMASKNKIFRSYIGTGYSDTIVPPVIQRNILENPGWYTQYTPYQAEISQGRLEALLNFQTMIADLTGLPLANASLLDEGTAAAEAMAMCWAISDHKRNTFVISEDCHPQTIAVVETRAKSLGIRLIVASEPEITSDVCGILVQYPTTDGQILDYTSLVQARPRRRCADCFCGGSACVDPDQIARRIRRGHRRGKRPALWRSDGLRRPARGVHVLQSGARPQDARTHHRRLEGRQRQSRVSPDAPDARATHSPRESHEQHLHRPGAAGDHGGNVRGLSRPGWIARIAQPRARVTALLAAGLKKLGHNVGEAPFFDTLRVQTVGVPGESILAAAQVRSMNFRSFDDGSVGVSLDETTTRADVELILQCFVPQGSPGIRVPQLADIDNKGDNKGDTTLYFGDVFRRNSQFLTHPVFSTHHSETEMLRYIFKLQSRDLSLAQAMIPLGSCTMKLNATSEMLPVTWPEFSRIHPFAPLDQVGGYLEMFAQLEKWLAEITGFAAVSLQPNAGSQGEYAGLVVIRAYHESRNEAHRTVCLIPESAHGTNPASAVIAGFSVVGIKTDSHGSIDLADLKSKAELHRDKLACLMITYPSTRGVFEESVKEICQIIHAHGGQVYMDGANMNAQVGLCRPGDIGADVCHLNLHKTFCIPHGGGGPGMGPIGVATQLAPFLPGHPVIKPDVAGKQSIGPISAAPYGSASILTIPWVYIALMGGAGLKRATEIAILNANYMAKRLEKHYPILFVGTSGRVAHEFVMDARQFQQSCGVTVEDIAKRLMDYGFHAPTMSWPVPGTLMVEPTESEPKPELDRFCDAMIRIREEILAIEEGKSDRADNALKNAPHTIAAIASDGWSHPYSREQAAYPAPWLRDNKFFPFVARVDNPYGDRNLVCTCPPVTEYAE